MVIGPASAFLRITFLASLFSESRPQARLSEILFVQAIRFWTDCNRSERGVVSALAEPGLSAALAAIHEAPAKRWSLDDLEKSGNGRTAFAEHFRVVVGGVRCVGLQP